MTADANPRVLTVFDTTVGEVASVAVDVACDIRRYEILGAAEDSAGTSGGGARS